MNSREYREKMYSLLEDATTYMKLDNPPSIKQLQTTFNDNVRRITEKLGNGGTALKNKLISNKLPEYAYIYGGPKIHKAGCPLRPIVSSRKAPNKNLSIWLAGELGRYLGVFSESHIKHSMDFIDKLRNIESNGHIVSFDVVSLFTNVPVDKVLDFLRNKFEEGIFSPSIEIGVFLELTKLCVTDTYFTFESNIYKQNYGVAMGSSLSPILANIYMEYFESTLVPRINIPLISLKRWWRYVDDIFAILEGDESKIQTFLEELNSFERSIQFTLEKSQENKLPFLDILIEKKETNFDFTTYRKPTHTNSYIHFFSYHSHEVKMSVIVGLFLRALRICDPHKLDEEVNFIRNSFLDLAYPAWFIERAITKARRIFYRGNIVREWNKDNKKVITLPYMPTMKKVTSKLNDDTYDFAFRFQNTIRNRLCKNKLITDDNREVGTEGGVYIIDCMNCQEKYIGETGRELAVRLKEHKGAVSRNQTGSAVAKHCWEKEHRMDFNNSRIVYKSNNVSYRRVVEGAIIREVKVVEGNKAFTSEDPFSRRLILREANVTTDNLGIRSAAQQIENNPNQRINRPQQIPAPVESQPEDNNIRNRTGIRQSRRIRGLEPD